MTDIAVVIPCYNHGRFVAEALESVRQQTRAPAEIVIVDDGSTDLYTRQVLAGLRGTGVRMVRIENGGVAAARNCGIRMTSARYLMTLDADDRLEPTYLEVTANRLDSDRSLDFVSTAYRAFGDASYVWTPPSCDLMTAVTRGAAHAASLFRREVWDAVGGFDETLRTAEDLEFWIAALSRGFRGEVLDEPLLRVRVSRDSKHHRNVARGGFDSAMQSILRKHRRSIEALGPNLLLAKETFLVSQRAHGRHLVGRRAELEQELAGLQADIVQLTAALRDRGMHAVDCGDLRRPEPISPRWGLDRGRPIDRYYIERFLEGHRADIRGRVLEVKDSGYTAQFGGEQVRELQVLDVDPENRNATIVADLTRADHVPSEWADCFILTQTVHIIYDVGAALHHAARILKPGGVLLCTLPAVSRVNYENGGLDGGDYWRFTESSARALFAEFFPLEAFDVTPFGNVFACTAFLYGLGAHELDRSELDHADPWFPLGFCVRAVKSASDMGTARAGGWPTGAGIHQTRDRPLAVFAPYVGGLSETFIRRHMEALAPDGTVVVTSTLDGPYGGHWRVASPTLVLDDYPAEEREQRIGEFLRRHGVEVVLGEYLNESMEFLPLARRTGCRFVAHAHGYDVSQLLRQQNWREAYRRYSEADAIVTMSRMSKSRLVDLGLPEALIHVIPYGVDVPCTPVQREIRPEIRCLAVGRMVPKKGPLRTLEAFRLAGQLVSTLRLDLVGEGPLLAAARRFVEAWGLNAVVTFHEGQPPDVVQRLMREADVFLQHSMTDPDTGDEEGLPVAVLEAMASGLPVLSTRHAGIPEAVADGTTGLLVEQGDVNQMAECLVRLARDAGLRHELGLAGWRRTGELFTWERRRAELLGVLGLGDLA